MANVLSKAAVELPAGKNCTEMVLANIPKM